MGVSDHKQLGGGIIAFLTFAIKLLAPCKHFSLSLLSILPLSLLNESLLLFTGHSSNSLVRRIFHSFNLIKIHPLLKKPSFDQSVLNNSHPGFNLPFLTQVSRISVAVQLIDPVNVNRLFATFQCCFGVVNSTETTLLRVLNDSLQFKMQQQGYTQNTLK